MNEFIVWDKKIKMFWEQKDIITMSRKIIKLFDEEWFHVDDEDFTYHNYIGKTDINNKKIYADCSIVEFFYPSNHILEVFNKEIGVFKYDKERLQYLIYGNDGERYDIKGLKNIKIIDTIQENKLGLIK